MDDLDDGPSEEEFAALARAETAECLKCLASIADSSTAEPEVREDARRSLEHYLVRLKELTEDVRTPSAALESAIQKLKLILH